MKTISGAVYNVLIPAQIKHAIASLKLQVAPASTKAFRKFTEPWLTLLSYQNPHWPFPFIIIKHGMVWIGRNLKDPLESTPPSQAQIPSTGCSNVLPVI